MYSTKERMPKPFATQYKKGMCMGLWIAAGMQAVLFVAIEVYAYWWR